MHKVKGDPTRHRRPKDPMPGHKAHAPLQSHDGKTAKKDESGYKLGSEATFKPRFRGDLPSVFVGLSRIAHMPR